jgi:hypothetical protein
LFLPWDTNSRIILNSVAGNGEAGGMAALKMELRQLPEFQAGKRYFIKPRLNQMWTAKLPSAGNRKQDFYFAYPLRKKIPQ